MSGGLLSVHQLQWRTNKKSQTRNHTRFRLVPQLSSLTLDDPEQAKTHCRKDAFL